MTDPVQTFTAPEGMATPRGHYSHATRGNVDVTIEVEGK